MSEFPDKFNDPFAPPKVPCVVCCIHCGSTYDSWRIVWREMPGEAIEGAWCCPIPGCDGVGFRFDIHPVDPKWEAENGGMPPLRADYEEERDSDADLFCDDDDEECEEEGWDDAEREPKFALPVDEFDEDAFWIDPARLAPRPIGNTPQPPFNQAPYGHAKSPDLDFDDDDIPF